MPAGHLGLSQSHLRSDVQETPRDFLKESGVLTVKVLQGKGGPKV